MANAKEFSDTISARTVSRGIRLFTFLTIIGVSLVLFYTGSRETLTALYHFHYTFIPVALLLVAFDFIMGAARIHIFTRELGNRTSFWACMRANWANYFMAAMTPFQTGGGLAQIWILARAGTPVPSALTVSLMNFLATMLVLLLGMISVSFFHHFQHLQLAAIMRFSSRLFYLVLVLFVAFLIKPEFIGRMLGKILTLMARSLKKHQRKILRIRRQVALFVRDYKGNVRFFLQNKPDTFLGNIVFTFAMYFNKVIIAYVIVRGLGLNMPFTVLFPNCVLLIFLFYFCPTPGASLVAETTTAALMSTILPLPIISLFTLLWRFFTTYLAVAIGGYVVIREVNEFGKQPATSPHTIGL